jgi:transglutaminase-like putative cysteine protease
MREEDGPPEKRTIPLDDVYFEDVLSDLIARRADHKNFHLNLFDTTDLKVNATDVEILKTGDNEIEASVTGLDFTRRYRIARDGQIREAYLVEQNIRFYATDSADAQNITDLNMADVINLKVRSQKSFPHVYRVSRAQVQVRWKKIPLAEFKLEDNRQKIVRTNQSGDEFEAVVEMTRAAKTSASPVAPAAEYLGEDKFIKPRDPAIRKQAAAIVGDSKDFAEVVRKLLPWVSTNVVYQWMTKTLSGPEVLAQKRGKCTEYAILFASLARAAGIPTRIVLGEAYEGDGLWGGHMWNEVWLGEWIAVDSSPGTFVSGPSHLKLIDSPTVEGTQGVRRKLIDNLAIEILAFEEAKAQTTFKLPAPDQTWTLKEEDKQGTKILSMKPQESGIEFALVVFDVPPGTQPGKILEGRLAGIGKLVRNYKLIETGEAEVAHQKAPSAVFSQSGEGGEVIVNQNILLVDGTSGYLFAWIVPQEKFAILAPVLKKILASFELVNP